jgi:ABC-2 type transport system permease protein
MSRPSPATLTPTLTPPTPPRLPRAFSVGAWFTLLGISAEQLARGRRLLVMAALFTLPSVIALAARYDNPGYLRRVAEVEESLVFYMIPQALVPLSALILASGMIRDEIEGQTLTYLLIRPLPRPMIYAAKLAAAWLVTAGLAAVFTTLTLAVIHWGAADFWGAILPARAARVAALGALSLAVYVSLFGALSLVVRWVLPLGVAYIVLFEGFFANIDFAVRRVTVLWYVRILAERWLGLHVSDWSINLDEAPGGLEALLTLLGATLVLAVSASFLFGAREIRMKTPEGG